MDASRRAEETSLPTDYVIGTGIVSQVMTLFRRHGGVLLVQVETRV